jgi:hypothetical protein
MTAYRPLVSDNNIRIKECTSGEYDQMLQQIAYLYSQNPTVQLSVVASGGNISPAMVDRRYYTGTSQDTGNAAFGTATNPTVVNDVTYDKITQTVTAAAKPAYSLKPVRVDGSVGVIEMTEQDVIDTYIAPVVTNILAASTASAGMAGGGYFISTTASVSNATNLGTVYIDTRSVGTGAYPLLTNSSGEQFFDTSTINEYRLQRADGVTTSCRTPLIVDGTSGLKHMTVSEFDTYFAALIRHCIYDQSGQTLRYNVGTNGSGSGTVQGSVMTDTQLTGSTQVDRVTDAGDTDPNDYMSQLQPSGTPSTHNYYELKLERT